MAEFVSEALAADHVLGRLHSGNDALDTWLQKAAMHAAAMRNAKTFAWHEGDGIVVGYFSLAAHLVVRERVPRKIGRGAPAGIPAVLLARLALSRRLHRQGLGGELLWDALTRAVAASEIAAARVIVVDAIDESAARFYEHHGFVRVPNDEVRLVQKVSDVAAALERRIVASPASVASSAASRAIARSSRTVAPSPRARTASAPKAARTGGRARSSPIRARADPKRPPAA